MPVYLSDDRAPTVSRVNVPRGQQVSHTGGTQPRTTRDFRIARHTTVDLS